MKLKLTLFALVLGLASCKSYKEEMEQASHERDSLYEVIGMRDSSINDFLESYNEIQVNLDSIANKGEVISSNITNESQAKSSREKINEDIATINLMVKENREKIAELTRKLRNSGNKNAKLEKMIETLNSQIADKDKELAALNDKIATMDANITRLQTSVDTLTATSAMQAQTISDQTVVIHTAYYKVGKSRELQDMKIINKEGGLLGIGKSSKLNQNIDNSKFTKIDYTQTTMIPVNGENAKIITAHPSSSYALDKEGKNKITQIRITNPELFWSASKYLVVMIN